MKEIMEKFLDKLDFWSKLTPTNKVLVTLLCVILFIGWHGYQYQEKLEAERDNFKDRYEKVSDKYENQVKENQKIQNELKDGCIALFQEYQKEKDSEIKQINYDFNKKYLELLDKYQEVITKVSNNKDQNN